MGLLSTLGTIGGMFIPGLGPAGGALGGTIGGALEGNTETNGGAGTKSESISKAPWEPAQQYMRQGLADTAALQKYYQKTPFNPLQIEQYSNQFNDLGNFRENVMPGLLGFANSGMSQGYQRGGSTMAPSMRGEQQPTFSMRPTAGLLDLNGAQYNPGAQIAATNETRSAQSKQAPMTAMVGQSDDPVWEKVLMDWEKEHQSRFGRGLQNTWQDYADPEGTMAAIRQRYLDALGG